MKKSKVDKVMETVLFTICAIVVAAVVFCIVGAVVQEMWPRSTVYETPSAECRVVKYSGTTDYTVARWSCGDTCRYRNVATTGCLTEAVDKCDAIEGARR